MFGRSRIGVLLTIASLLFAGHAASGKPLEERKWIEVRSTNFRVRSLQNEKDTIELARNLEMFRVAVSLLTNVSNTQSPIPTVIFAMKGARDFVDIGVDPDIGGFMLPGLRYNTIVIREVRGMQETSIILHEYVHFLVRNHGYLKYPKWFDEGFAEYLSATRTTRKKFEIGRASEARRRSLAYGNWIPMRRVVAPDGYEDWGNRRRGMFYAQAWALVHYLQNRRDRESSFVQDMSRYLELYESGIGELPAFEEAFGIDSGRLGTMIKKYLERGRFAFYAFDVDKLVPDFKYEVATLSRPHIALALGQLALGRGELEKAQHWFQVAETHEMTRPQAEAGLGDVLKFRGEFDAAEAHFQNAVALAPGDPYCQLDLAQYWQYRSSESEAEDERLNYLERARIHYVKAWKLDDSMPETYAWYGKTFVMEGKQYDKAIEMLETAENLLPSHLHVRLMLAEAYAGAGRREDAIRTARSVVAWSHRESESSKRAEEILAEMDEGR